MKCINGGTNVFNIVCGRDRHHLCPSIISFVWVTRTRQTDTLSTHPIVFDASTIIIKFVRIGPWLYGNVLSRCGTKIIGLCSREFSLRESIFVSIGWRCWRRPIIRFAKQLPLQNSSTPRKPLLLYNRLLSYNFLSPLHDRITTTIIREILKNLFI